MTVYQPTGITPAPFLTIFQNTTATGTIQGVQCNSISGACFLEPGTRGTQFVLDCQGLPNCTEFKLRMPDRNGSCLGNVETCWFFWTWEKYFGLLPTLASLVAQALLADCLTGASLFIPSRKSLFRRLLDSLLDSTDTLEDHFSSHPAKRQASALAVLWNFLPIPDSSGQNQIRSARAGLTGGNCLSITMFVGACSNDAATSFAVGGSGLIAPAQPAEAPANLGLIIGCVVGGLAAIALIGMGICLYRRKKSSEFDRDVKADYANVPGAAPANVQAPLFDPKAHVELTPLPSQVELIGGRPVSTAYGGQQARASAVPPTPYMAYPGPSSSSNSQFYSGQPQSYPPQQPQQTYAQPQQSFPQPGVSPHGSLPIIAGGLANAAQVKDMKTLRGKQLVCIQPYAGKLQDEVPIERGDVISVEQAWVASFRARERCRC